MLVARGRVLGWMTSARASRALLRACVASALALGAPSAAGAQSLDRIGRDVPVVEQDVDKLVQTPVPTVALRSPTFVEERIADAELQMALGDPLGASILLTDVVDHFPEHRAYPDALYLLGESLFRAGDVFGARRRFTEIVDRAEDEARFRARREPAVVRLIEIAIRTRDFRFIEAQIQSLDRGARTTDGVGGATAYYRGRYLFGRAVPPEGGEGIVVVDPSALDEARVAFSTVPQESAFYPKAKYHLGTIHALRRELDPALAEFLAAAAVPPKDDEGRQVAELSQLAAARVLYELGRYEEAVDAYQAIPRGSPHFSRALFEIAWVFIALGDSLQAERALEVLAVADPESPLLADGKVLRGNLLLRNGRYEEADEVFREARERFGPIVRELDATYASLGDPKAHFQRLVRENVQDFDVDVFLPGHVKRWVETDADFERALRVLRDLAEAKRLLAEAEHMTARLQSALENARPVALFHDLRVQAEKVSLFRGKLVAMLEVLVEREARATPKPTGEHAELRRRRREVESLVGAAPTGETTATRQRDEALEDLRALRRQLRDLEVVIAGNEARITATDRFLASGELPESTMESVRTELEMHRKATRAHRRAIAELQQAMEVLKLQIGIGDDSAARADALQREYVSLVEREIRAGGGARDPEVARLLPRILRLTALLAERESRLEEAAFARVSQVRGVLDEEVERLASLTTVLEALAVEAEDVVGTVALQTFLAVRARFQDLVIRTDVGQIDIAWAIREDHRSKVERLTRDRAREIQALDAEFREIMTDGDEGRGAR